MNEHVLQLIFWIEFALVNIVLCISGFFIYRAKRLHKKALKIYTDTMNFKYNIRWVNGLTEQQLLDIKTAVEDVRSEDTISQKDIKSVIK